MYEFICGLRAIKPEIRSHYRNKEQRKKSRIGFQFDALSCEFAI